MGCLLKWWLKADEADHGVAKQQFKKIILIYKGKVALTNETYADGILYNYLFYYFCYYNDCYLFKIIETGNNKPFRVKPSTYG